MSVLTRLHIDSDESQAGFTLVEVIVAMMVFAIIALGVAYTLLSSFAVTNDSRSREVATDLATQEIDTARATSNVFTLLTAAPRTVQVPTSGGIPFTITRTVSWVDNSGSDVNCGTETGSLEYKRVNVQVTWPGMVGSPISVDTLLAPTQVVNTDTLGTIIVLVKTSTGAPAAGVTVSVSPSPGSTPTVTDAQGCSYVLNVPPAAYTVSVSEPGYIGQNQSSTPSHAINVVAGASSSAQFALDSQGTVAVKYATNFSSLAPVLPTNLNTSFSSTLGTYTTLQNTPANVNLYPASSYTVDAGAFLSAAQTSGSCLSPDSGSWSPGTNSAGAAIASPSPVLVSFPPGGTATANVPMGVVAVTNTAGFSTKAYITATSTTPVSGSADPGCTVTMSYTFGQAMAAAKGSKVTLALPFGTWILKMGTSATPTTSVTVAQLSAPTGATGTTISTGGVVTLDPRVVTP